MVVGDAIDFHCPNLGEIRARLVDFDRSELFLLRECHFKTAHALAAQTGLRWYRRSSGELQILMDGSYGHDRRLMRIFVGIVGLANRMIASGHA